MGSPLPLYTPLSCISANAWVRTFKVPSPKTEACLNIARVRFGAKGSKWQRRRERERVRKSWESVRKGQNYPRRGHRSCPLACVSVTDIARQLLDSRHASWNIPASPNSPVAEGCKSQPRKPDTSLRWSFPSAHYIWFILFKPPRIISVIIRARFDTGIKVEDLIYQLFFIPFFVSPKARNKIKALWFNQKTRPEAFSIDRNKTEFPKNIIKHQCVGHRTVASVIFQGYRHIFWFKSSSATLMH